MSTDKKSGLSKNGSEDSKDQNLRRLEKLISNWDEEDSKVNVYIQNHPPKKSTPPLGGNGKAIATVVTAVVVGVVAAVRLIIDLLKD